MNNPVNIRHLTSLIIAMILLSAATAAACPACADNVEGVADGRAAGFGWSILLLMGAPFLLGGIGALLLKVARRRSGTILLLGAMVALTGCGEGGDAGNTSDLPPADMSKAVEVSGVVEFVGEVPEPERMEVAGDPYCGKGERLTSFEIQNVQVQDGKLADAFVYVSRGLEGLRFEMPTDSALLDQQGCRYYPHVQGVRVNQPIIIRNSDPTIHNVHARPEENDQFNIGQTDQSEDVRTFEYPEVMIPVTCDVHGWMKSWIAVLDHPAYATTGTGGTFSFRVPPGEYEVTAWHERLGTSVQTITVAEGEPVSLRFVFGDTAEAAR